MSMHRPQHPAHVFRLEALLVEQARQQVMDQDVLGAVDILG